MDGQTWVEQFEANRPHLRAVAYRMLGSFADADDAVQEAWLRASRADTEVVENMSGWLTTIVARVCLNMLQSRKVRPAEPLDVHVPDPIISTAEETNPEQEVLLADAVGMALMVVLDALAPPERVAFVLHDVFAVPFDEIAPIVGRTPTAARQLASRARRRVHGTATVPDSDLPRQRAVVDAFLAASRNGDFEGLLAVLDPDVVLRADGPGAAREVHGATTVAGQALTFSRAARLPVQHALVNGAAGVIAWALDGRPFSIVGFTIVDGLIVEIDILGDRARLEDLGLEAPEDLQGLRN
jgi:RNA polymerase sigma-70 factor (ECF subfamily)